MENNRAFLSEIVVSVYFFVRNGKLFLAEECYFFLILYAKDENENFNLYSEYFTEILDKKIKEENLQNARFHFLVYRNEDQFAPA